MRLEMSTRQPNNSIQIALDICYLSLYEQFIFYVFDLSMATKWILLPRYRYIRIQFNNKK